MIIIMPLLAIALVHLWVGRFAARTGTLPGRGGWIDRQKNPRDFAMGRTVSGIVALGCLIGAATCALGVWPR
jgi:hypothetical protein